MRGSLRWMMGSMCALVASCAWAQGGRINFHGAVITPTCTTAAAPQAAQAGRLRCGTSAQVAAGTAVSYSQTVASLADSHRPGDRLLDYFTGYLAPAALAEAKLVIRTYE